MRQFWNNLAPGRKGFRLILLTFFILTNTILLETIFFNVQKEIESQKAHLKMVVYIKDEASTPLSAQNIRGKIRQSIGVRNVIPLPKNEALELFKEKVLKGKDFDGLNPNPLPFSFIIELTKAVDNSIKARNLSLDILKIPGVMEVSYGKEGMERLFSLDRIWESLSLFLRIVLVISALAILIIASSLASYIPREDQESRGLALLLRGASFGLYAILPSIGASFFIFRFFLEDKRALISSLVGEEGIGIEFLSLSHLISFLLGGIFLMAILNYIFLRKRS